LTSTEQIHTFGLSSKVKDIITIKNVEELVAFSDKAINKDFILLGEGSNCVFVEDYKGSVLRLSLFGKEITEAEDSYLVKASSSENWHEFVKWTLDNNVFGLENLALIPGTVGASPIQNIGAYGREVKDFVSQVEYYDLLTQKIKYLNNEDCRFSYRDSIFKHELKDKAVILSVTFKIPKQWLPEVSYGELKKLACPTPDCIFKKVIEIRQSKLPNPQFVGNAGSFFKNPIVNKIKAEKLRQEFTEMPQYEINEDSTKLAAGWLIEQCGLKGYELNGAAVHDKQALVLVNKNGDATGLDLIKLIKLVRESVHKKFGVVLETEVRLIGKCGEYNHIDDIES